MRATVLNVPRNALSLARRSTALSMIVVRELGLAALHQPLTRDRIAWEAWAAGQAAEPVAPTGRLAGRARTS